MKIRSAHQQVLGSRFEVLAPNTYNLTTKTTKGVF